MRAVGDVVVLIGAAWCVLAAVGVLKFDDVYSRMHAATKATTLGLWLAVLGAVPRVAGMDAAKLVLVGVMVFLTAPVGAHLVGRAVHRSRGSAPVHLDAGDELARDESQA
ncbi:MAG TPA: monovalent cation/H(+) antiporter subunit G [Acidimicrobiia bacterium]|nr:monovalent cation/H(+) antiporter subunit G [Acidimicrobiia bacterium]